MSLRTDFGDPTMAVVRCNLGYISAEPRLLKAINQFMC